MRKLILAVICSLALAGCSVQGALDTVKTAVTGIENPVSKSDLYNFENGMIIAFAGLNAYRQACELGSVGASCKDVIRQMQVYTKRIPAVLRTARVFVKQNDQVNAKVAFATLRQLMADFKAIASANNVKVQ